MRTRDLPVERLRGTTGERDGDRRSFFRVVNYSKRSASRAGHSGARDVSCKELEFMSKITAIVEKILTGAHHCWN